MTSVNEARELPESTGSRVLLSGIGQISPPPNTENLPCDAWHLGGYSNPNIDETEMMSLIKEKLPRVNFPVKVGSTGYIIWPDKNVLPTCGYTLDEIGRMVGVVDEIRFFQRYTRNCMLVANMGKDGDYFTCLTQEEKGILQSKLQQK